MNVCISIAHARSNNEWLTWPTEREPRGELSGAIGNPRCDRERYIFPTLSKLILHHII